MIENDRISRVVAVHDNYDLPNCFRGALKRFTQDHSFRPNLRYADDMLVNVEPDMDLR